MKNQDKKNLINNPNEIFEISISSGLTFFYENSSSISFENNFLVLQNSRRLEEIYENTSFGEKVQVFFLSQLIENEKIDLSICEIKLRKIQKSEWMSYSKEDAERKLKDSLLMAYQRKSKELAERNFELEKQLAVNQQIENEKLLEKIETEIPGEEQSFERKRFQRKKFEF